MSNTFSRGCRLSVIKRQIVNELSQNVTEKNPQRLINRLKSKSEKNPAGKRREIQTFH